MTLNWAVAGLRPGGKLRKVLFVGSITLLSAAVFSSVIPRKQRLMTNAAADGAPG